MVARSRRDTFGTRLRWWEKYQVSVPAGACGAWTIETFNVARDDQSVGMFNLRAALNGGRRGIADGRYTRLLRGRDVIMSDTPAEVRDHLSVMLRIEAPDSRRVLLHGLGLGMVLHTALRQPHVEQVDVVEIDQDVIDLVGGHYMRMAQHEQKTLTIHLGDALTFRFAPGQRWDVAWHDIWDSICRDNLEQMARLNRRYAGRSRWQGCWAQEEARRGR